MTCLIISHFHPVLAILACNTLPPLSSATPAAQHCRRPCPHRATRAGHHQRRIGPSRLTPALLQVHQLCAPWHDPEGGCGGGQWQQRAGAVPACALANVCCFPRHVLMRWVQLSLCAASWAFTPSPAQHYVTTVPGFDPAGFETTQDFVTSKCVGLGGLPSLP
jgi:hypothetical protein